MWNPPASSVTRPASAASAHTLTLPSEGRVEPATEADAVAELLGLTVAGDDGTPVELGLRVRVPVALLVPVAAAGDDGVPVGLELGLGLATARVPVALLEAVAAAGDDGVPVGLELPAPAGTRAA